AAPASIARAAPQPGDRLTICGYGSGTYRAASGRCTQYYAPGPQLPEHVVELDVQARQGDSGGPIFNDRGELAGVLFGASSGTTLGSFGGRVTTFLASLAPDIGGGDALQRAAPRAALAASGGKANEHESREFPRAAGDELLGSAASENPEQEGAAIAAVETLVSQADADSETPRSPAMTNVASLPSAATFVASPRTPWTLHLKNAFAVIGVLAVARQALRLAA
ncbi:MAG: trypsin-like serine protease, partial [Planctomycetales bacterium]|nr:trypsin-like serine protease [Planctomycetales bacterium]